VGNRSFCVGFGGVEDVCCSTIVTELPVHWHVQIPNLAIDAKDFEKMVFVDILGELLNNNLRASHWTWASSATDTATLASVSAISSRATAIPTAEAYRDLAIDP